MTKKRITEMNEFEKLTVLRMSCHNMETCYILMQMIETRLGYSMITPYSGG